MTLESCSSSSKALLLPSRGSHTLWIVLYCCIQPKSICSSTYVQIARGMVAAMTMVPRSWPRSMREARVRRNWRMVKILGGLGSKSKGPPDLHLCFPVAFSAAEILVPHFGQTPLPSRNPAVGTDVVGLRKELCGSVSGGKVGTVLLGDR